MSKNSSVTKWIAAALIGVSAFTSSAWAESDASGAGNGGGRVQADYIAKGKEVLRFLAWSEVGKALAEEHKLDLNEMRKNLTIWKIKVVKGPITDNTGSVVDARLVNGVTELDEEKWERYFSTGVDIHELVFHEMLRAAGVNDDNFVVSSAIRSVDPRTLAPGKFDNCLLEVAIERVDWGESDLFIKGGVGVVVRSDNYVYDLILTKRNFESITIPVKLERLEFGASAAFIVGSTHFQAMDLWISDDPDYCVEPRSLFKKFYGTGASAGASIGLGYGLELSYLGNGSGYHAVFGPSLYVGTFGAEGGVIPVKTMRIKPAKGYYGLSAEAREFLDLSPREEAFGKMDMKW